MDNVRKHLEEDTTQATPSRLRLLQFAKFLLIKPELVLVSSSVAACEFMLGGILKNSIENTVVMAFDIHDKFDKSVLGLFDAVVRMERGIIKEILKAS